MKLCRAAAVALLVMLIPASPAWAHAVLVETVPSDGARLETSPAEVTLVFNEPVGVALGALRVYDSAGRQVDRGNAAHGESPEQVVVSLPELATGSYVVTWHAVSADGHPVKGAFVFQIGDTGQVVEESLVASLLGEGADVPFAAIGWLLRWVTYAAVLLVVGASLFQILVARSPIPLVLRLIRTAVVIGVAGSALQIPLFAAEATGLGLPAFTSPLALGEAAASSVGWASLIRVGAFGVIWVAVGREHGRWTVTGVLGLVGAELITGHTRITDPAWLVMGADAIHVVAAGLWFGGLAALTLSLRAARAEDDLTGGAVLVGAFSKMAGYTVLALGAAGVALAWMEVRTWQALVSTHYGWTLLVKTALAAAVLLVATYNNRVLVPSVISQENDHKGSLLESVPAGSGWTVVSRVRPSAGTSWRRLSRTIRIELAGLMVVIGATALLVNLQPAAEAAGVSGPYSTTVPFGEGQLNLVVDPNSAGVNEIHLYVLTTGGLPALISGEATIEFRMPGQDIGPIIRQLQVGGPGHYIHVGPELTIPGEWVITVRQRISEFEENTVDVTLTVNS